ncbi:integrase catalytic domain-containing protein [Trichonephila clavipes]|uniref:Integrase catalytic domain-containing protein n=1 Tax=Trichonephila clavipes TaxID=2585209 RepID=A0A8X6R674_TRICX|nr:integrase catalytic domain-containing protein [Trichonephila clavipes]
MAIAKSNIKRVEDILEGIYYDAQNPASYGGVKKLAKVANVPVKVAEKWLIKQDTQTLHKPVRFIFQRRKTLSYGIGDFIQSDLVDISKFSRQNKEIKFLLTSIDVFSKKAYAQALKNKI